MGIRNRYSLPGHPQANGQTKFTNQIEGVKGAWPDELPRVLWAYKTTMRTLIGETPFKMEFWTEAVVLVEIGMSSIRRAWYDDKSNDEGLKLALDCLPVVRDDASQRMALYQERMMRYYNQRVKLKRFNPRDMVLRKISQATKDLNEGKLGPNWEGPYKVIRYSRRGSYYLEDTKGKPLSRPWNAEHLKKYY